MDFTGWTTTELIGNLMLGRLSLNKEDRKFAAECLAELKRRKQK